MKPSPRCLELIKHFEGCRLKAYQDSGGVLTIGYGHTPAVMGQELTQEAADTLLEQDAGKASDAVNRLVKTPLTQNEHDALTDFVFNLGAGAFADSTLLRRLNYGDKDGAAEELLRWVRCKGKVLAGLVVRRKAEQALFCLKGESV